MENQEEKRETRHERGYGNMCTSREDVHHWNTLYNQQEYRKGDKIKARVTIWVKERGTRNWWPEFEW